MRRFLFAFLMLVFAAGSLSARMRRPRVYATNDPSVWFTAGDRWLQSQRRERRRDSSIWNFGNSTNLQYRASLEKGMTSGSSFGLAGSWAHVPFEYSSSGIYSARWRWDAVCAV